MKEANSSLRRGYIGYGDLGQQIAALVSGQEGVRDFVAFDDYCKATGEPHSFAFADFEADSFSDLEFFVCLGYKHLGTRRDIVRKLVASRRHVPSFIHATAFVAESAVVGAGSVIYPLCNIDKDVSLGLGVLLHNSAVISHDSTIGDGCYVSPGAVISGDVAIGEATFIGAGAVIANGVHVGANVRVGVGAVVTTTVLDGCSVIGNPMRILDHTLELT